MTCTDCDVECIGPKCRCICHGLYPAKRLSDFEAWLDRWVPHYPKAQYQALVSINDALRETLRRSSESNAYLLKVNNEMLLSTGIVKDQLAAKIMELESLKNKIVERAQQPPIIKAKSAAEIRRVVEAQNEREFEESIDGIR